MTWESILFFCGGFFCCMVIVLGEHDRFCPHNRTKVTSDRTKVTSDRSQILDLTAVLDEHGLISKPNPPQGRTYAASRAWHREQRAKIEADEKAKREAPTPTPTP